MNAPTHAPWAEANQRYLSDALASVRAALERRLGREVECEDGRFDWMHDAPPALEIVGAAFGLSAFERDLLLLCAGVELDSSFAALCAQAQGEMGRKSPTFSLALAALPGAHWSALTPLSPLRSWRLIEVERAESLTTSPLRIDECVLHFLAGAPHLDERLSGLVREKSQTSRADDLAPSHRAIAEKVSALWSRPDATRWPVVQLCGEDGAAKPEIAGAACQELGLGLRLLSANALPPAPVDLDVLMRLWNRQAVFEPCALLLECDDLDASDAARHAATRFIEEARGPLLVSCRERRRIAHAIAFDVPRPGTHEQHALWCRSLGASGPALNGQVDELTSQFRLGAPEIRAACDQVLRDDADERDLSRALWDACRMQARPRLDALAQRIEPMATWDDLVLPAAQRESLRDIAAQVGQRGRVLERWGFAAQGTRGLGLSALFAGQSGTGKTMAAEVLAGELRLDLFRIDLSGVVSKYIGETEKNLRRVFDAAEEGGTILLFDEADALFGKRSEVKDSHDRYANIEVSYLLQRMESYRGLAILTTNLQDALDTAFLRRIRFVVPFSFPDMAQRAEIWRRVFPSQTPTEGLDAAKLARLNVSGGNIRNIALNAAFLASAEDEPVRMTHLRRAAQTEYAKLERSLTEAEVGGWA